MGKLVKYCTSCDEGFAERFGFCPVCGSTLEAFEMNPVAGEAAPIAAASTAATHEGASQDIYSAPETVADADVSEMRAGHIDQDGADIDEPAEEDEVPPTVAVPATVAAGVFTASAMHADEARAMKVTPEALDQGYYITVIEEKNVKQRNMLLLGSAAFCIIVALSATVYSLFDKDLGVGAIDSDKLFSAVIVDEPLVVEEQHVQ